PAAQPGPLPRSPRARRGGHPPAAGGLARLAGRGARSAPAGRRAGRAAAAAGGLVAALARRGRRRARADRRRRQLPAAGRRRRARHGRRRDGDRLRAAQPSLPTGVAVGKPVLARLRRAGHGGRCGGLHAAGVDRPAAGRRRRDRAGTRPPAAVHRDAARPRARLRGPLPRARAFGGDHAHGAHRALPRRRRAVAGGRPSARPVRRPCPPAVAGNPHRRAAGLRRGDEGAAGHRAAAPPGRRHARRHRLGGHEGLALRHRGPARSADRRRRADPGGRSRPAQPRRRPGGRRAARPRHPDL
ncbi:MAG: Ferric iron ABC transporter, permease protein, partial [uncultured Solirubrobacteraceae bacterium]